VKRLGLFALGALSFAAIAGCSKSPVISIPPGPAPHAYVSNFGNHTITAYSQPLGSASTPSLTFTPSLPDPDGMAVDAAGNLYVAFPNELMIQVFKTPLTSTSTPSFTIGPIAGGGFTNCLTIDVAGNLWVSSEANGMIFEFTPPFSAASVPSFTMNTGAGTPAVAHPEQVTFDQAGDMAVVDFLGNQAVFYRRALPPAPPFAATPTAAAVIASGAMPDGVAFDVRSRLMVAVGSGAIQVFTPPFATGNSPSFSIQGPLIVPNPVPPPPFFSATSPFMLSFDAAGNLYVPYDTDNANGDVTVYAPPFGSSSLPVFTMQNAINSPNITVFAP
jgi:hypothetical protein